MKKIISILMALGASLMISSVVIAAEAPEVKFDVTPITAQEDLDEYGAVDNYDAYLLTVTMSGVDASRTNANSLCGRLLTNFGVSLITDDMSNISIDDSYVYESDADAGLTYSTGGMVLSSGLPEGGAKGYSFPAKGSSISADEDNLYATAVLYVQGGKSVNFSIGTITVEFMTYASTTEFDESTKVTYNSTNPNLPVVCETTSLTLGESAPSEPKKAPEYFNASFTAGGPKYIGNKGMKFFFNSAKLNKVESYIFNFDEMFEDPIFESEMKVDVAIKVNDVPEDDTVTLTGYEWSETARVDN